MKSVKLEGAESLSYRKELMLTDCHSGVSICSAREVITWVDRRAIESRQRIIKYARAGLYRWWSSWSEAIGSRVTILCVASVW